MVGFEVDDEIELYDVDEDPLLEFLQNARFDGDELGEVFEVYDFFIGYVLHADEEASSKNEVEILEFRVDLPLVHHLAEEHRGVDNHSQVNLNFGELLEKCFIFGN